MKRLKVITIFGTRPEAIKMAPLIKELEKHPEHIESLVCVTAQHRQMLDQVLDIFKITPDYDLNVMKDRQTLNEITMRVLQGLEPVFQEAKPDLILVHGDTLTTFLASYAAFMQQIQVGHVEAGLRTWNKMSPYPEEMNRQLTGVLADLHFAPTQQSADNLRKENKSESQIYVTGNTVTDVFQYTVQESFEHPVLEWAAGRRLILMTAHRREAQGEPHRQIFRAVKRIADEFEDIAIVYPVHPSPAVKEPAHEILGNHPRIKLVEPFDASEFHNFYPKTHMILTDSGGLQEEAPSFGVPVLVLRDTTERPEGIQAGTLELVGTDEEKVYERARALLTDPVLYNKMSQAANPYGDGKASQRIVQAILHHFGKVSERPETF
ncbi:MULTISPECIES: non-hydrolyzing UDP-N-acetylglucosamine 2-epimerase [Paenibacillus]|uniref:UDP-N-acetylglucosamine 2-epimerase (non-hydrolyzing) n=3 Tax=Paenibacillus TaxID=44249 RepID=A0ABU3RMV8_9BACL|nr:MULTISPECIES: UDP-N-acetylglucosamine 2-epimerase (non-hydrolyzing) [Paenibacillus]MBA2942473.1 UDP-N-acetylglucosamine 2-epimerase (non-hydrolyzing) [Paenibacillus sp. CGMCC 1.16610]MCY9660438.1 UDP-N-acetylglucosamine 2-epimerase (non-hydrolyzing) [Paenibacillus anseongense]MDU0205630.1 UDP-N-acetylglucosamine 2-epimerase (non-hydrolyzing) [Paenibacillus sp. PFR10]MEB4797450.1 UDP-N-acetylglucosamine 2-epimerase (non-hydrolyzing) [Paenibacillus chondroitinus]MEC0267708.1 UDP-N-acetylgluco